MVPLLFAIIALSPGWSFVGLAVALLVLAVVILRKKSSVKAPVRPSPQVKQHWLLDPEAEGGAESWHIGQRTVSVGRGTANFVQVNTPGVSRIHCQLRPKPEGLQLVDMTSSNGTIVNGQPVTDYILKDHDVVSVGDRNFIYREQGDFGENAGFRAKEVGRTTVEKTNIVDGPEFSGAVKAHLAFARNGRDIEKTAEELGMNENDLRDLLGE